MNSVSDITVTYGTADGRVFGTLEEAKHHLDYGLFHDLKYTAGVLMDSKIEVIVDKLLGKYDITKKV